MRYQDRARPKLPLHFVPELSLESEFSPAHLLGWCNSAGVSLNVENLIAETGLSRHSGSDRGKNGRREHSKIHHSCDFLGRVCAGAHRRYWKAVRDSGLKFPLSRLRACSAGRRASVRSFEMLCSDQSAWQDRVWAAFTSPVQACSNGVCNLAPGDGKLS
jgi:hypothetical protein